MTATAICTLGRFSFHVKSCEDTIVELGVLQPLLAILASESRSGAACYLLRNLACSPSLRGPIAEAGVIPLLVPLVDDCEFAAQAIGNLVLNHPANQRRAEEAGARPVLERILADEEADSDDEANMRMSDRGAGR